MIRRTRSPAGTPRSSATPCSVAMTSTSVPSAETHSTRGTMRDLPRPVTAGSATTERPPGDRSAGRRKTWESPPAAGRLDVDLPEEVHLQGGVDAHVVRDRGDPSRVVGLPDGDDAQRRVRG